MKKYIARLLFNINVDNGSEASEFDEQLRVIESDTSEDAFYKARLIGKNEEEAFVNVENKLIRWHFIDVTEIYPLDAIGDGEQLYSQTHKIPDPKAYISYIRSKSMEIQLKHLTFA